MNSSSQNQKKQNSSSWTSLLVWIFLALFLRWQVVEPRWIPSGSMLPTLEVQDRILIEKIRPRLKAFNHEHLDIESVVIFHPPQQLIDAGYDQDSALIKRVVGLPGDKIQVSMGKLFRNGESVNESWVAMPIDYEMAEITIPSNSLWVLGDNRNNSLDSHLWGVLPEENVIGTAIWRYWPIKNFGPIRFPTPKRIRT